MQLAPGTRLAHYEISVLLGRGGMGEVWRAKDTKLGRDVAIKVLPDEFTKDTERLARFEREARVLASLDHPNVASIYGIEDADGATFLVMQLAAGEDLSERLRRGPVPPDEAITMARQIIDALEAAHERGIVHRDLKPANIKIDPEGKVRILDFGLAKAMDTEEGDPDLTNSPTMVKAATHAGVILGTAAYMSPEQARGKVVDKRADIWAFGVVLWEMLTGQRLFGGETVSDTLAAVLTRDVELDALPESTPAAARQLIASCLTRDVRQRLRDIGDARLILDRPAELQREVRPAGTVSYPLIALAGLVIAIAAGLAGSWLASRKAPDAHGAKRHFRLALPEGSSSPRHGPTLSPDGRKMTWIQDTKLYLVDLATSKARLVPDSEGAEYVGWAPDSTQVAFVAGGRLYKHDIASGQSTPITSVESGSAGGIAWGANGRLVICSGDGDLFVVSSGGGAPEVFLQREPGADDDFHDVSGLPDNRGFLFATHRLNSNNPDTIEVVSEGKRTVVVQFVGESLSDPVYSNEGYVLFQREGVVAGLWAVPFSLESLSVTGDPIMVDAAGGRPSVSSDGVLAFDSFARSEFRLATAERDGSLALLDHEVLEHVDPLDLSSDGSQLLTRVRGRQGWDLWMFSLEGNVTRRLTFANVEGHAAWLPDGDALLYDDDETIWRMSLGEGLPPVELFPGRMGDVAGNGKTVVFIRSNPETKEDVWVGAVDGSSPPRPLVATRANETEVDISPDGKWVAYNSDESGRPEIYVKPVAGGELKWQLSTNGGSRPKWDPNGARVYYLETDVWVNAVEISGGDNLKVGQPRRVLTSPDRVELTHGLVPLPGGQRFVVAVVGRELTGGGEITIVTNWTEGLGR